MKIVYAVNIRIPTEKAHSFQILKMCESFSENGIDLELIIPTRINSQFEGINPFDYYGIKNNFKINKLKTFDPVLLLKLPQGIYIKIQTLLFIKSLNKYLKQQELEDAILYTRDPYLLPLLFKFSSKVVWEAHDLPGRKEKYVSYWSKCFKIITIAKGLKDDLIDLGIDESKILTASDGVDLSQFSQTNFSREDLGLPLDKKLILYSGHLFDWKGAHVLAEAANFFSDDVQIVFLGGTDYDLKRFREKYQGGNINIIGRVEQKEVPKYLQSADVLVLPNSASKKISTKYTSPLKLFEYMAAKKPIVASDLPSIREILNSSNSVLVPSDNPQALAKGINKVLGDAEFSNSIANRSFNKVKDYTWEERAKIIINFISTL